MTAPDDDGPTGLQLRFRCSRRWDELQRVQGRAEVRYCDECRRAVHRVTSQAEFDAQAQAGHCVAFDAGRGRWFVGEPAVPWEPLS